MYSCGSYTSAWDTLTINDSLRTDSIRPAIGYIGTAVTVYGAYFGASQGSSTVVFGDSLVTPTSWSQTQIQFMIPLVSAGIYDFIFSDGIINDTLLLAFRLRPHIITLKHPMGRVGYVDTCIGNNFDAFSGADTLWGATGTPVTVTHRSVTGDTTIWVAPTKARGTYQLVHTNNASGGLKDSVSFRLLVPSITIINP
jgi:hypothetical protein